MIGPLFRLGSLNGIPEILDPTPRKTSCVVTGLFTSAPGLHPVFSGVLVVCR